MVLFYFYFHDIFPQIHHNIPVLITFLFQCLFLPIYIFSHLVRILYIILAHNINARFNHHPVKSERNSSISTTASSAAGSSVIEQEKTGKFQLVYISLMTLLLTGHRQIEFRNDGKLLLGYSTLYAFSFKRLLKKVLGYSLLQLLIGIVALLTSSNNFHHHPDLKSNDRHYVSSGFMYGISLPIIIQITFFLIGLFIVRKGAYFEISNQ
jgi:hypothetical protein